MQQDPWWGTQNGTFSSGQAPFEGPGGIYQEPAQSPPPSSPSPPPRCSRRLRRSALVWMIVFFAAVVIGIICLASSMMRIRTIEISGLTNMPPEQAAQLAGLHIGDSYLGTDAAKVQKTLDQNRYLVFEGLEKHFPNAVVLHVHERVPRANLMVMAVMFTLDEEGMVMERSPAVMQSDTLPIVTGLQTREARVGRMLVPIRQETLETYTALIAELNLQGCAQEIQEINLSDLNSILLITRDEFTVDLGTISDIRAKVGTVRAVLAKLRAMGKHGGAIDATIPGEATYSPVGV